MNRGINTDLDDFEKSLRNVKTIIERHQLFGLPTNIFISGLALILLFWSMINFLCGFITGIIYYFTMYRVFRQDPDGLSINTQAIFERDWFWSAGDRYQFQVNIISSHREGS